MKIEKTVPLQMVRILNSDFPLVELNYSQGAEFFMLIKKRLFLIIFPRLETAVFLSHSLSLLYVSPFLSIPIPFPCQSFFLSGFFYK